MTEAPDVPQSPRIYSVSERAKRPLVDFLLAALDRCNCHLIKVSDPSKAPIQLTFESPNGERMGIVAYAFLANAKPTKNRPLDEHRFQIKYGKKDGQLHDIWQDPYGLYTTLFLGINPETGFFVGTDPVLHNPTRMFISFEFKEEDARTMLKNGWHYWERQKTTRGLDSPVETVVGGTADRFLDYVRFEQAAAGLDQGHRYLLAEHFGNRPSVLTHPTTSSSASGHSPSVTQIHRLSEEFELEPDAILSLIDSAPRLKMAVRGWVAETHLQTALEKERTINHIARIENDGQPDFDVTLKTGRRLLIECKNVLRKPMADGRIKVDFQKTRASKENPCSRYYSKHDFQILAACLHPATEKWEFQYQLTQRMAPHRKCEGKLDNNVKLDTSWFQHFDDLLPAI